MAAKKLNFFGEKKGSNFCQKYDIQNLPKMRNSFSVFTS